MTTFLDPHERQATLLAIVNACPLPIAVNDLAMNVTFINAEFIRTFGYTLQDIPTLEDWWARAYPDPIYRRQITETWASHIDATLKDGSTFAPVEAVIRCNNGESKTAMIRVAPLGQAFEGLHLVILIDISQQIEATTALADAHHLLNSVIDAIPMRVFWKDRESRYIGCNTLFAKDSGKNTPHELLGRDDFSLVWKEQAPMYCADDKEVMTSGIPKNGFEETQTTPEGLNIRLLTSKVPLRNAADKIIGVLGVYEDITELKARTEALHQAENQYRQLFETNPVPLAITDLETGKLLAVNQASLSQYGYTRKEIEHMTYLDVLVPEDIPEVSRFFELAQQGHMHPGPLVRQHRRKDGSRIWVQVEGQEIEFEGKRARFSQMHDITALILATNKLQEAEERYHLIFDSSPVALSVFDEATGEFLAVNNAALEQYGYSREDTERIRMMDLLLPEDLPRLAEFLAEEKKHPERIAHPVWQHRKKDGSLMWVQVDSHAINFDGRAARIAQTHNISRRVMMEQELRAAEARYKLLFEASPVPMAVFDRETFQFLAFNDAAVAQYGYSKEETGGLNVLDLFYPEDVPNLVNHLNEESRLPEKISRTTWRHRKQDGTTMWVEVSAHSIEFSGRPARIVQAHDITQRVQAEEALQIAAMVYQHSSEAMIVTDANNKVVAINPAFTRMTGYSEDDVLGKDPSLLRSGHQDQSFYHAMWQSLDTTGQWQGEIWNLRKNGEKYAEWLTINTIYDDDGAVHRRVALFSDITEKKRQDALIWNQANYDTLTQLPNRRLFQDRLELELKKAHRDSLSVGLLFIDLDRFKEVNDTLGHHMGDELLVQAARRIQQCVRESDSVARLGGDEFTVILPGLNDISDIGRVSQSIIDALGKPFQLGEDQGYISASVGITVYPEDATSVEGLLKNADQAMYEAKREGRNRYSYFTASMQEAATARMRLVRDIHRALAANEFMVHFQPIVELSTGDIHKAEALLRWNHPHHGFISPAIFIPIAENTGLIHEIGNWVFNESVRQVKRWQTLYGIDFQISVNISPVQFRAESSAHKAWIEHIDKNDITGSSIVIEITEGLLLHADADISNKLLMFRDAGIQVAIDDFGTGYSSLSYLKKFDIDFLKIDQSFVRNLGSDDSDLALSEAIIVMAHKLGLKVIAEGVETEQQCGILKSIGCDYAQGYLYSKALQSEQFEELLNTRLRVE